MGANLKNLIVSVWLICGFVGVCWACNGYSIKIHKIENCYKGDDAVISTSDDWKIKLDDECNVIAKGCVKVKAFKTAFAKFRFTKPPLPPIAGELDICEAAEQYGDIIDPYLSLLNLPNRCPVAAIDKCLDGSEKINIAQHKGRLNMILGKIDLLLNITHDTGRSCVHANLEVTRLRKL